MPPRRLRAPPADYTSVRQATLLVLLVVVIEFACGALAAVALGVASGVAGRAIEARSLTYAFGTLVAFWSVLVLAARRARQPLAEVAPFRRVAPALVLAMALTAVGAEIVLSQVSALVRRATPAPTWLVFIGSDDLGGAWAYVVAFAVAVPAAQEPLLRGLLLRSLLRRHAPLRAVAATAALFAAVNLNPWRAPQLLALGLLFGWWVVGTGSLVPALLGHALANVISVLAGAFLRWLAPAGDAAASGAAAVWRPWWFNALGLLLAAGGLAATRSLFARHAGRRLTPLPLAPLRPADASEPPGSPESSKPRAQGAAARALSAAWWTTGWIAYVAVSGVAILLASRQTAGALGRWSAAGVYALVAAAVTGVLYATGTLRVAVRVVAPILFALVLLFFTLFRPPDAAPPRAAAPAAVGGRAP